VPENETLIGRQVKHSAPLLVNLVEILEMGRFWDFGFN